MEENKEVTKAHVQCDPNHAYCLKSTLVCIYTTTCDQRLNNRGPVWHTSIIQALGQWLALKKHLFTECGEWNSENYCPHKNMHTSVRNSFICNRPQMEATQMFFNWWMVHKLWYIYYWPIKRNTLSIYSIAYGILRKSCWGKKPISKDNTQWFHLHKIFKMKKL